MLAMTKRVSDSYDLCRNTYNQSMKKSIRIFPGEKYYCGVSMKIFREEVENENLASISDWNENLANFRVTGDSVPILKTNHSGNQQIMKIKGERDLEMLMQHQISKIQEYLKQNNISDSEKCVFLISTETARRNNHRPFDRRKIFCIPWSAKRRNEELCYRLQ